MPPSTPRGPTYAQLAQAANTTPQQVKRDKRRGAPTHTTEAYVAWRSANVQSGPRGNNGVVHETARLRAAQSEIAELEAAQRRGELIAVEDVRHALQAAAVTFSSQLEALPGRMANELASISEPALIRSRLLEECRRIRASVAEEFDRLAAQDDVVDGIASSAADAGRVGGSDAHSSTGVGGAGTVP